MSSRKIWITICTLIALSGIYYIQYRYAVLQDYHTIMLYADNKDTKLLDNLHTKNYRKLATEIKYAKFLSKE